MRYARLFVPYRGYWDIRVDMNSIEGGYHGYQYNCIVLGSGAEITCYLTTCPLFFLFYGKVKRHQARADKGSY